MTLLNPRNRMICIRISEEEYAALKRISALTGARSISMLMRDSMRKLLDGANRNDKLGEELDALRLDFRILKERIEQLAMEIATLKPVSTNE